MTFDFSAIPVLTAAAVLAEHRLLQVPNYLQDASEEDVSAVPLALWLTELLRPKTVVSLDGYSGVVHAAVCQVVLELGLKSRCYIHQAHPPSDLFMTLCQQELQGCSHPLLQLSQFDAGQVDLMLIELATAARVADINWQELMSKLSQQGVLLLYGGGIPDVPHEIRAVEPGQQVVLGTPDMPVLLILGAQVPAEVQALGVDADVSGLRVLLQQQGRRLSLEALARQQALLTPDPTAPQLIPPQDLAQAKAQIAQLIEQQAADLDALAARFAAEEEERQLQRGARQEELRLLTEDLQRKDEIIATLEARIAAGLSPQPEPVRGVRRLLRR